STSGRQVTVNLQPGDNVTCTFTNTPVVPDTGSLKLAKHLSGGPAGYTGPFTIHYDCDDGTAHDGDATVSAGASQAVSGLPTGTSCTVSEPTLPSVPNYTFGTPTSSPPATVTLQTNGSTVTVTTNTPLARDTGSLELAKSLDDGGSGYTGPFTIHWDC